MILGPIPKTFYKMLKGFIPLVWYEYPSILHGMVWLNMCLKVWNCLCECDFWVIWVFHTHSPLLYTIADSVALLGLLPTSAMLWWRRHCHGEWRGSCNYRVTANLWRVAGGTKLQREWHFCNKISCNKAVCYSFRFCDAPSLWIWEMPMFGWHMYSRASVTLKAKKWSNCFFLFFDPRKNVPVLNSFRMMKK